MLGVHSTRMQLSRGEALLYQERGRGASDMGVLCSPPRWDTSSAPSLSVGLFKDFTLGQKFLNETFYFKVIVDSRTTISSSTEGSHVAFTQFPPVVLICSMCYTVPARILTLVQSRQRTFPSPQGPFMMPFQSPSSLPPGKHCSLFVLIGFKDRIRPLF